MTGSIYNWSTTAASNANSDGDINFAEGQAPSTLNNSDRQVMARVAEYLADNGGALVAGGSANAITVTANSAFTAYADGLILALRIAADNTAATTLNANGVGAKSIRKMLSTGESALAGAELQADGIYLFRYSTALNSAAGGWLLLNPTADLSGYATKTGVETLTNKTMTSPTINGGTWTGGTDLAVADGGTGASTAANARTNLGLVIGTDVQAYDATLASLAAVPGVAGDVLYASGTDAWTRLAKGSAGQQLRMNSGGTAPEWYTPVGEAKAWVSFNGVTTVTVFASFNVSSVVRNGSGDYTINFTNAFADTNYAVVGSCEADSGFPTEVRAVSVRNGGRAAGSVRVRTGLTGSNTFDLPGVFIAIFSN